MTNFIKSILNKATSPAHYHTLIAKGFWQASGYLVLLLTLISLINTIPVLVLGYQAIPTVEQFLVHAKERILEIFPAELELQVKNGALSINQPEPYYIAMPPEFKSETKKFSERRKDIDTFEHLAAIDTKASSEQFATYKSIILLTRTALVVPDKNNTLKIFLFSSLDTDFVLNKAIYEDFARKLIPYLDYVVPTYKMLLAAMLLLWPWIYSTTVIFGYWLYVLVLSPVLWVIAKLFFGGAAFQRIYVLALYGLTLPLLLQMVLALTPIGTVPFLFTGAFIAWMANVLAQMKKPSGAVMQK